MYRYYPEGHGFRGFGGGHFLATLIGLLVIGLLVAILVMLIISIRRGAVHFPGRSQATQPAKTVTAPPTKDPAIDEARMRYARGEITREEFASITRDLRGGSDTAELS
jgi:uncharacterized membrane protein